MPWAESDKTNASLQFRSNLFKGANFSPGRIFYHVTQTALNNSYTVALFNETATQGPFLRPPEVQPCLLAAVTSEKSKWRCEKSCKKGRDQGSKNKLLLVVMPILKQTVWMCDTEMSTEKVNASVSVSLCFRLRRHQAIVTMRKTTNRVKVLYSPPLIPGFTSCYSVSLVSLFLSPNAER